MNAHKHGLTAETIVIGDEDPKAFDMLRAELEEEFGPQPGIERELVERLAIEMWRMRRIPVFEAALIEVRRAEAASTDRYFFEAGKGEVKGKRPDTSVGLALIRDSKYQDTLGKLSRYQATLLNAFSRTLQQLLLLQDRRARESVGEQVEAGQVVDVAPSPPH